MFDYNNKTFVSKTNTPNGEVSDKTIFNYYQKGNMVWGNYAGGSIVKGNLLATVAPDGCLDMVYHHINSDMGLRTGKCKSTPQLMENGKLLLKEVWEWTSGDFSKGESVIEEI